MVLELYLDKDLMGGKAYIRDENGKLHLYQLSYIDGLIGSIGDQYLSFHLTGDALIHELHQG